MAYIKKHLSEVVYTVLANIHHCYLYFSL